MRRLGESCGDSAKFSEALRGIRWSREMAGFVGWKVRTVVVRRILCGSFDCGVARLRDSFAQDDGFVGGCEGTGKGKGKGKGRSRFPSGMTNKKVVRAVYLPPFAKGREGWGTRALSVFQRRLFARRLGRFGLNEGIIRCAQRR